MSTDVMKPTSGGLVLSTGHQSYDDAGRGTKGVDRTHFAPPLLNVAQDLSKVVKNKMANLGDFFISSTQEVFDGTVGINLVVCGVDRYYVEWRPNNGGYVARHSITSDIVAEARTKSKDGFKLKNGLNDLAETFAVFGLLVREDGSWTEVIMPFSSMKIGPYKKQLAPRVFNLPIRDKDGRLLRNQQYPSYAHALKITTKLQPKGNNEFYNVVVEYVNGTADGSRLDRDSALYKAAAQFAEMIEAGLVNTAESESESEHVPF